MPCRCATSCATGPDLLPRLGRGNPTRLLHRCGRLEPAPDVADAPYGRRRRTESIMATLGNIVFYADDPRALAHFWSDVFGYPLLEWEDPLKQPAARGGSDRAGPRVARPRRGPARARARGCSSTTRTGPSAGATGCISTCQCGRRGRRTTREAAGCREGPARRARRARSCASSTSRGARGRSATGSCEDPEGNEFCLQ